MLGKMSVAQKGAAAFFILALIGAIAGGVSYTKTVGAMSEVQTASRISDVTSEALGLERVIFDQVLSLKTFLLTGDRDWLNRSQICLRQSRANSATFARYWKTYHPQSFLCWRI